jgi:hypothetical protein
MTLRFLTFTALAVAGLSSCSQSPRVNRAALLPPGPTRTATSVPGIVPAGSVLVVRTGDTVNTRNPLPGTIYDANVAKAVVDQYGDVLIPQGAPVALSVAGLWYLGPGGVGMTELMLGVRELTVNGKSYPVVTEPGEPHAGGLGVNRHIPTWVGGGEPGAKVYTNGRKIYVPADTLLAFYLQDPIRLSGYRR